MVKLCLALGLSGLRLFGFVTDPCLTNAQIHRAVGDPEPARGVPEPTVDLRVVTWNIEQGLDYDALLSVVRRLDPVVLLLQEVARDCRRKLYRDVPAELAAALDMNW